MRSRRWERLKYIKEIVIKEFSFIYNRSVFYRRKKRKNESENEGSKIYVNILEFIKKFFVGLVII